MARHARVRLDVGKILDHWRRGRERWTVPPSLSRFRPCSRAPCRQSVGGKQIGHSLLLEGEAALRHCNCQ